MARVSSQPPPMGARPRLAADKTRLLAQGKIDSVGAVTLTASTTTTVVDGDGALYCGEDSVVVLSPRTANAAGALATTYITPANGSFTITHANNAQTDRTFGYSVLG